MVLDYFREVKVELRKVSWPTRAQTKKYTILVIVVSVIVGIYLTGLDYLLSKVVGLVVR
ncbi:MAG: preprotein translocase subunit SecE [Patescibacteria group bacterium]|nr:preprotein translocase subunit SecE [Patescibacteria group bacterium]